MCPVLSVIAVAPANHVLRLISAATGIITTIAGIGGQAGFAGDGGPATSALLNLPYAAAIDTSGDVFFTDSVRHSYVRGSL